MESTGKICTITGGVKVTLSQCHNIDRNSLARTQRHLQSMMHPDLYTTYKGGILIYNSLESIDGLNAKQVQSKPKMDAIRRAIV